METVGILGTGRMAVRIADLLVQGGHEVWLGSRDPARAQRIAQGLSEGRVRGVTYAQAMQAPFVLPAIFVRDGLLELIGEHADALAGKIVLDILNPFNADYSDFVLPWTTSAGEELAKRLPESRVVGIFKNIFWEAFDEPRFPQGVSDVYVTGDDTQAKEAAMALFQEAPFRFVDAGGQRNARVVERMTLFAAELGSRNGYMPRVGWRFLGEPWEPGVKDRYAHLIRR
ncbi:MAG: NAD(P)-binding domain-containing protein [Ramlibacter sp.]|nr:NAD(P)-binding domain-containing protein [Ramlibacter sp.]